MGIGIFLYTGANGEEKGDNGEEKIIRKAEGMEIRNLQAFVKVAELRSFSRAAEYLGYSQSAVTVQIRQLEEELGQPLLERIGKQVKVTEAGERFLPRAVDVLDALRAAEESIKAPEEILGRLCLGTAESLLISVLPPVMMEFCHRFPQVELGTRTALVEDLFQMLRQNELDLLYFLDRKTDFSEWIKAGEWREPVVFVTNADHPLAKERKIPLERLLQEPFLLTEKGVSYRYAMEQMLAARGLEIHPFLETGNTDIITQMLLKNRGISFLPQFVVEKWIEADQLAVLDVDCLEIEMWSQLVYHRNKWLTPQMERFIEMLTEMADRRHEEHRTEKR